MQEQRSKQAFRIAIKHYWNQALIDWKTSFTGLLLTGIGTIFVFYIPPLIIAKLLSRFKTDDLLTSAELLPYVLAFGSLWFLGELMWRLAVHLMIKAETRGLERLYANALRFLLEKDLAFFHDNFAGSLTKKTVGYSGQYVTVMDTMMFNVFPNFIPMIFVSFILWQFSPWLTIGLIAWTAFTLLLIIPMMRRRRKLVTAHETASNKVSGYVADVYSNIDAVRAFSHEDYEEKRHLSNVQDLSAKMKAAWDYQNRRIDMTISPIFVLTNVFGLVFALHLGRSTGLNIETVFLTFSYYSMFTRFLWEFNGIYRRLESALSDAGQFTELLINEPALKDIKSPNSFKVNKGAIVFKDVGFRYQDNEHQELFENLNLSINPGEKIGLVGHSGGGKTTLTKLILRFMDIDSGQILIDGQNIATIKQSDLRQYIAYVPQDPYMFHRSITDNIRYGKLKASEIEIEKAARMSHSSEFIKQLPDKYETLIGERGVKLSGGQRQRIAIARAMIKDVPILLLDEATSALDSHSEMLIQDALWKLMEGRTAIVIAHRLSTVQKMDRILVMDDGKIVEEGSHKELLRLNGIYANLWAHQSGGFLEE